MSRHILLAAAFVFGAVAVSADGFSTLDGDAPLVIAHRGASAYLPEHTLAGYELAIRMGADIVEPDVQLTSDGALVAMHDTELTHTTDVVSVFAPRNGGDKVSDFTLAEIRTLTVMPTSPASTGHPGFTPSGPDAFKVPTLREVLDLVTAHTRHRRERRGAPEAQASRPMGRQMSGCSCRPYYSPSVGK